MKVGGFESRPCPPRMEARHGSREGVSRASAGTPFTDGFVGRQEAAMLDVGTFSAATPKANSSCAKGSCHPTEPPVLLLVKSNGQPVYRDAA